MDAQLTALESAVADIIVGRVARGIPFEDAVSREREFHPGIHWGRTIRHAQELTRLDDLLARCREALEPDAELGW